MQYPEFTSVTVVQAWPEPGSLKSCGGHHLEPQVQGLFVSGTAGHFSCSLSRNCSRSSSRTVVGLRVLRNSQRYAFEPLTEDVAPTVAPDGNP